MVCLESHTCLEHRWANAIFPFVTYLLSSSRINKAIDAIVDTGSPFTVLSDGVLGTRLPIHIMRKSQTVKLAGFRFFRHPTTNVTKLQNGDG